jgi:hypothetical protein
MISFYPVLVTNEFDNLHVGRMKHMSYQFFNNNYYNIKKRISLFKNFAKTLNKTYLCLRNKEYEAF